MLLLNCGGDTMDFKELDGLFYYEHSYIDKIEQVGDDVILVFSFYNTLRFVFKNPKINIDIEPRLAVNLLDYKEYINSKDYNKSKRIEMVYPEYGVYDDNSYYFRLHLSNVPDEWFDYSKLKIKPGYREEIEEPIMSLVTTNLSIEEIEEDDENKAEIRNVEKLNNFNFHDSKISNFKINKDNISFLLEIDWFKKGCFRFSIDNSEVYLSNCDKKYLKYLINKLTNDKIVVFSGESGILDNNKCYLKLWFDYPFGTLIDDGVDFDNKLGNLDINLSNEYDDTGRLYIKFIADDIDLVYLFKFNV